MDKFQGPSCYMCPLTKQECYLYRNENDDDEWNCVLSTDTGFCIFTEAFEGFVEIIQRVNSLGIIDDCDLSVRVHGALDTYEQNY